MKRVHVEIGCDFCGQGDYYFRPNVDEQAKDKGWIVEGRKHFCDERCKAEYLANKSKIILTDKDLENASKKGTGETKTKTKTRTQNRDTLLEIIAPPNHWKGCPACGAGIVPFNSRCSCPPYTAIC